MSRHQHARGQRIGFAEAPEHVRRWVAERLGGELMSVTDCVGGMSPGPAARIRSDAGATAFVKACGPELNPVTPQLLRDERRILAVLPECPHLPRLLDGYDDGDWVVLLIPPTRGFRQSPEDYLASLRSTSGLARALMTESDNTAFDEAVVSIMSPLADDEGMITLDVTARLVWGAML